MVSKSPVRLLGLPPVMEAEHDGEGAGGQQLLVVVVIQAVGCRQCKSVANLFDSDFSSSIRMYLGEILKLFCIDW